MKILVPLDGSDYSECVLPYVRSLGQRDGVRVGLLRATDPFFSTPFGLANDLAEEMRSKLVDTGADYLARVEGQLSMRSLTSWSVVGKAREEICRVAAEQQTDLIVMASHGHSGLRRWVLGSVAEGVIRMSPCPVLLIRQPAPQSSRFRHILVPIDGSPASLKVHLQLAAYAGRNTRVTLLTATGLTVQDHDDQIARGKLQSYMEKLEENLKLVRVAGVEFRVQVVDGEAGSSILGWAGEEGCDLIAMSSHAHSSIRKFFLGSVTQKVLREGCCSVLIFPVKEHEK